MTDDELERGEEELDELGEDELVDPLDALPEPLRGYAKGLRAVAVMYVLARNAGRVEALLRAYAEGVQRMLDYVLDEAGRGGEDADGV